MKNIIQILCLCCMLIVLCGCSGTDSGRLTYKSYYIKNITDEEVKLTWWQGFIPYSEVVIVPKKDRILLYEFDNNFDISGALNTTPFFTTALSAYDSVTFAFISDTITYSRVDCHLPENPLCEENYDVLRSVDTKKLKLREFEFVIK